VNADCAAGLRPLRAKWTVTPGRGGGSLIKGEMHSEPSDGLYPGFSASGQDVWVDEAQYDVAGIVVSAVGARCGKAFRASGKWAAVANTHVLLPRKHFDRDFLWWVFNDEGFWLTGGSAQPYVQFEASLDQQVCVPESEGEQRAIARYLDRETAKIDALVEKKERLVELLQEKRSALITHAVTKGLDPNVPTRDSGIEWLGQIPAHWQIVRLKHHARFDNSGVWGDEPEVCDSPTPVARTADISTGGRVNFEDMPMRCLSDAEKRASLCRAGEIIVVKSSGSISSVVSGKAALVTEGMPRFSFSNFLMRVIPDRTVLDSRFAYAFLTSSVVRKRIELMVSATTYPNLRVGEYRAFEVPLPSLSEQRAITELLDRETTRIDALTAKVQEAIERLKEYRTALISAAVTGKIDVRGVER